MSQRPGTPGVRRNSLSEQRSKIAELIVQSLELQREQLSAQWRASSPIRHFVADGLLPDEIATSLAPAFPEPDTLLLRSSIRERKRVGVDVRSYDPVIGDVLYSFQDPRVIAQVATITGIPTLEGDPSLYASGISVMAPGDFLNPHIDNSHDGDIRVYRAMNLLYYVAPDWNAELGGNLELWDDGVHVATTVVSAFNRLVVMETNQHSWHSVAKVNADRPRLCFSNYYFSPTPPGGAPFRHVTTFTGRPEEKLKRAVLKVSDGVVLNAVGKALPSLTKRTKHRLPTDA
jgi:Rps23 Pro-64 3,4-dihydroxylase Tpa1-like proline 4-hydroxylase